MLLGGVLTSYLSWSWIFFINVPVGIAAALLAPVLLRESRPDLGHRHFDLAGAATVTGGLMLLVYALTRGDDQRLGLARDARRCSAASIALIGAFLVDRARARRGRSCRCASSARGRSPTANAAMAIIGAVAFSEFFLLTLYLQDVLRYSAVQSGVAFIGFALSVVVVSNLAQLIVGRVGVRATLTAGLLISASSVALLTRLPVDGHYFWDLFPAFVLGGAGMGLSFVPVTIASLAGRRPRGRRHRVRPRQHEPADRRRDRHRRSDRDRRSPRRRTSAARPPAASSRSTTATAPRCTR